MGAGPLQDHVITLPVNQSHVSLVAVGFSEFNIPTLLTPPPPPRRGGDSFHRKQDCKWWAGVGITGWPLCHTSLCWIMEAECRPKPAAWLKSWKNCAPRCSDMSCTFRRSARVWINVSSVWVRVEWVEVRETATCPIFCDSGRQKRRD